MNARTPRTHAHPLPVRAEARRRIVYALLAGEACLVLGSGASQPLAPDWERLVDRLGARRGAWPRPDWLGSASRDERIPLDARRDLAWTIGQTLRAAGGDVRLLHDEIYAGRAAKPVRWDTKDGDQIRTAAAFAVAIAYGPADAVGASTTAPYPVARRSFDVVTYNIDVLLEETLAAAGFDVEGVSANATRRWPADPAASRARREWERARGRGVRDKPMVRVFHPHGMLLRAGADGRVAAHDLVMTSEEYARYRFDPMSLPSLVELETYTARRCLFYGFSLLDTRVRDVLQATATTRRFVPRSGDRHGRSTPGDGDAAGLVPFAACHMALTPAPSAEATPRDAAMRRLETWRSIALRRLGVAAVYGDDFVSLRRFLQSCTAQLSRFGYPIPDDEALTPFPEA